MFILQETINSIIADPEFSIRLKAKMMNRVAGLGTDASIKHVVREMAKDAVFHALRKTMYGYGVVTEEALPMKQDYDGQQGDPVGNPCVLCNVSPSTQMM